MVLAVVLTATPVSLDEVRAASRANLQAIQAELSLQSAQAGRLAARSSILPRVDVSAGVSDFVAGPQRTFSTVPSLDENGQPAFVQRAVDVPGFSRGSFSFGVSVSQLLYDGGRWWRAIAQATSQEAAAQGQLDEQRLASELEAVRRFYELVRAQLTRQILLATLQRSRTQLERAQSLFEAGRVQRNDVLDAEVNVGSDEISLLRQENAISVAQIELLQWLGRPTEEIEAVVPAVIGTPPAEPASVPAPHGVLEQAKRSRPLLKALEAQIEASEANVDVARSTYFPSLSANAGYSRNSPTADPFFTDVTKQNAVSVGLNLSWNVFAGFATQSAEEIARVQLRRDQAQRKQALVELEGEVRRTVKLLETQLRIAALATKNRATAATQLTVEESRFSAGAGSNIDVRNAQIKVTTAELTQLQGRIDVEIARAALHRVTGAEGTP